MYVGALDRFQVVGVPPGTPLSFRARLRVASVAYVFGHTFASACLSISLNDGISEHLANACGSNGNALSWETSITIPLQYAAHQEFTIVYTLGASASLQAGAYARPGAYLSFEGLPQGAQVTSCQGYTQDFPVAARSVTWGALKTRYR